MVSTTPVIYGWVHDNLFDGDKSTCNHTSESQLPIPHQFSFKSEVPVKLRHIRIFHRDIWPFRDATPRVFEIWATNSLPNPDGCSAFEESGRDYRANQRSRTLLKKERVHIETQDTVVLYDRLPKNLD